MRSATKPLFRLQPANHGVEHLVTFYNNGPNQLPGLDRHGHADAANRTSIADAGRSGADQRQRRAADLSPMRPSPAWTWRRM